MAGTAKIHVALDMSSKKINNVADPASAQDAATKTYVDTAVAGAGAVSSVFGRTGAVVAAASDYSEAQLSFTDITTNDVSISKHGFVPKAPNDATKYLDGTGAYSVPAGSGAAGAMVLITDTSLSGSAASFDFTSIAGTYKHLRLVCQLRGDLAGSDDWSYLTFNNDTGSNYDDNVAYVLNTSFAASGAENAAKSRLGLTVCGGSAGDATAMVIEIPNYAGTTFRKQFTGSFFSRGSSVRVITGHFGGNWRDTSAITRVTLLPPGAGNFVTGSRVSLYGIN